MTINNSSTLPKLSKQGQKIKPNKIATPNLPPKPYTEYTIFFRLERAHILQSSGLIDEEVLTSLDPTHYDAVESPRPPKYEQLALPPYWYSSSHKAAIEKKRKHRKREGRMDLKTLSKTISASWRNADPVAVEYCKKLAQAEMKKYNIAIEEMAEKKSQAEKKALVMSTSSGGQQQKPNSKFVVHEASSSFSQDGVLKLQDLVVTRTKQQVENSVTTKMMPVATPPISNDNVQNMNSFNGTMGSGNNSCAGPQIDSEDQALLKMLQLQAARQQFQARQVAQKQLQVGQAAQQHRMNTSGSILPTSVQSSAAPCLNNSDKVNNRPQNKRRRASAPPVAIFQGMDGAAPQPYMGMNENVVSECQIGSMDSIIVGSFLSEDTNSAPKKQPRRRSSMISMTSHEANELEEIRTPRGNNQTNELQQPKAVYRRSSREARARQELSASFKKELENRSFMCVPKWEKKDADTLLDMLSEPQAREPIISNNDSQLMANQEMNILMETIGFDRPAIDFGMGDDGFANIFA
mmetsp:Transcript_38768/g.81203  ORF Transcript_38768/g.81203 Transcript_38768/m.81203 type:complete len:521 (+) Transcript_38768:94-1656(+)